VTGPKAVIRHEQWTLTPDREPDAAPVGYKMVCAVCGEDSEVSDEWNEPHLWALKHSGRNPSHLSFRETITRPWRTFMQNP
jgi:hypothetical protein